MLSFFPTRGASHTLWNDLKPTANKNKKKADELVERKTFFFLFSPHCVHQAQEGNRAREKLKMILHKIFLLRSDIFPSFTFPSCNLSLSKQLKEN
jgi:hypothetical protein